MSAVTLTPTAMQLPGVSLSPANFVYDASVSGGKDGVNTTFTAPTKFVYNLGIHPVVHIDGVKQPSSAYTLTESGGTGTGFDTIIMAVAPSAGSTLTVDYIKL